MKNMITCLTVLTEFNSVTDGRTDRQTELPNTYSHLHAQRRKVKIKTFTNSLDMMSK